MPMATGCPTRVTERSGCRARCRSAGRLTATAAGAGYSRGAGPGSTPHPGAMRPSTTDAGLSSATAGAGGPAVSSRGQCGPRRSWVSSAAARRSSIGFGGPVVGWYPLAPWHAYRPHYRTNTTYVTVINRTIIQRPPHGTPPDVNQRPGSTWVPTPRFRDPIVKVRIPAQTEKVADLQPMAPPPRPKRTAPVSDNDRTTPPAGRVAPPHVRSGQSVAQTAPKYNVAPPQPLPGADTTLSQPAPIRRVEPRPLPTAPGQLPEREAPRPKPNLPQEIVPPYQQLQKPFPAEPARTPPAAPPTVHQPGQAHPGNQGNRGQQGNAGNASGGVSAAPPMVSNAAPPVNQRAPAAAPTQRTAPPARAIQPSPPARAVQPAPPASVPAPVAPPQAPRAEPGEAKEQVARGAPGREQSRPEREAPPPRLKQAER